MSGIIVRFKTDEPVKFKEKGCDIEFAANVEGALYVNDYDQDAYGATNSERVENLGKMIIGKIQVQLSKWSEQDEKAYRKGRDVLAARLDEELMAEGFNGSVRIDDVAIVDEQKDLYEEQVMKPLREAEQEAFNKRLDEAYEPHGPLVSLSYDLFSHGMMAGSSSSSYSSVEWKEDGSVIYTSSTTGNGKNFRTEYKVTPEAAQKAIDYIAGSKLPELAKLDLPTPMVFDNFTSATIVMEFDDSSLGGERRKKYTLNCGATRMTYKSIENEVSALLKECKETGECIKNEVYDNNQGFPGMAGFMGMPGMMGMDNNPLVNSINNMNKAMKPEQPSNTNAAATGTKWTCTCGAENAGTFCANCGYPRPQDASWTCACGGVNKGKFCTECGQPKPV